MSQECDVVKSEVSSFEHILESFYSELTLLEDTSRTIEDGVVRLNDFRVPEPESKDCKTQLEPVGVVEKLGDCLLRLGRINIHLSDCSRGLNEIV